MANRLKESQIKFHLAKIATLNKEYQARKNAGEKRLWKMQLEHEDQLERIQVQIDDHKMKASELSRIDGPPCLPPVPRSE